MRLHEISLCHAGLINISMHITHQRQGGDVTAGIHSGGFQHASCSHVTAAVPNVSPSGRGQRKDGAEV